MEAPADPSQDKVIALEAVLAAERAETARIKAINADLKARNALLELQNEKMRRALFGQRSERSHQLVDQMELGFEELETSATEDEVAAALLAAGTRVSMSTEVSADMGA